MYHLLGTGKKETGFFKMKFIYIYIFLCKVDSDHSDVKNMLKK